MYGNVVGGNWYWGSDPRVAMYAQTGRDGVAHLVVPAVPLTVTASKSVQVNIPKSVSTVQVNVGGQLVNVTIYYSPSYVYLGATGLLVPPQTSLKMVVTAQTGNTVIPYASAVSGAAVEAGTAPGQAITNAATAPTPSSTLAQQETATAAAQNNGSSNAPGQPTSIPPIPASAVVTTAPTQNPSTTSGLNLLTIETIALAGAIAALVGLAIKTRH